MYVNSNYTSHYNNSNHHRIASKPQLVGICHFTAERFVDEVTSRDAMKNMTYRDIEFQA